MHYKRLLPIALVSFNVFWCQLAYASSWNSESLVLGESPAASSSLSTMQLSKSDAPFVRKDPWMAVGLGVGSSLGFASLVAVPVPWLAPFCMLSPFTVGLGHVYAGDPARGAWVTLGSLGAAIVALGLGGMSYFASSSGPGGVIFAVGSGVAVYAAYETWAGVDAYNTAERVNQEAAAVQR